MRVVALVLMIGLASAATAAKPSRATTAPEKVSTLMVFGNDPCPKASTDDEIVVCARLPENERYRIPKKLRDKRHEDAAGQAWANRAEELDWVSREGLPNSCSTNGSAGQTGCYQQFMRQWRAERKMIQAEQAEVP